MSLRNAELQLNSFLKYSSLIVHLIFDILYALTLRSGGMKRRKQNHGNPKEDSCKQNYW